MSPSGQVHGRWRKNPNPPQYRTIFLILLVGIPIVACVGLMSTFNFFGTGEPEGPDEVYEDYRGEWTAQGQLPGEEGQTTIHVSVSAEAGKDSHIEFSNPQCSARLKADLIVDSFTTFSVQGEPEGEPEWCAELYEVELRGDFGGQNYEKKLSDKVTLAIKTNTHSGEWPTIVDGWPITRLQ